MKGSTYFSLRVYRNMHCCSRVLTSTLENKRKGIPQVVADVLRASYPGVVDKPAPRSIVKVVQTEAHVNVSYSTALRGKKLAISQVRGSPAKSFQRLHSYLYMLKLVNPGIVTSVKVDANNKFKYLFVALGASIEGFRSMRKVIVVDAKFLKNVYGGMLVFATAQDPNHHHYPIAMGHTSIAKAVQEVYPQSQHGFCVWHLSRNVRVKAANGWKDLMFPKAAEYLENGLPLEKWARCYFKGDKYNLDTSNVCESMNSVFKKARKYALLPKIDAYIEKVSEWFNRHREDIAGASYSKKLVHVVGLDGKSYLVNLVTKSCECRMFDIDKIPCVHAIAATIAMMWMSSRRRDIHIFDLCSRYYLIDTWALAYCRTIYMVPHHSTWIIPEEVGNLVVYPPDYTKKSGRKKEKRFSSTGEPQRSNKANPNINLGRWFEPVNPMEEEGTS
ncbi:uncharacterized protein LOC112086191 [Eutrema salsugineum]|uniref:uncharacterized protein LOC112086191 n=1 Tax=Eutrema salsugineum TaxID=72664 RepID=UPI000CED6C15|nr:uncharacterized protein LOC112086191 [Eutrema salsugineum]